MKGRLFTRNVVTLVLTVLAGQMVAAVLVFLLVMEPQARRLAQMTADMTDIVGMQMARMTGPEREALVRRLNAGQAVAIRPGTDAPGGDCAARRSSSANSWSPWPTASTMAPRSNGRPTGNRGCGYGSGWAGRGWSGRTGG
jgi:hypothetical protein